MKTGFWKLGFLCCLVACDSKAPETPVSNFKALPPVEVAQNYQEKISELQKEIVGLRQENERLKKESHNSVPVFKLGSSPRIWSNMTGDPRDRQTVWPTFVPPPPQSLLSEYELSTLRMGFIPFKPGSISSSGIPVTEETPLEIGQDLQMKWGTTWWAATVVGFEPDGGIRMHYFGWDSSHDEIVPRSDLQLDTGVREKAIQTVYQLPSN